jgi:MFS family permease
MSTDGDALPSTGPEASKGSLAVIFLTIFIDLLGFGMVIPLLPLYAKQFSAAYGWSEHDWQSKALIATVMSSFSAMQFLFSPVWGRISDRVGRRPVLMIGLLGSVIFYTLFGIASVWKSVGLLLIARVGAGIAGGTISTAQAYIADCTSVQNRHKGMALIGAAFGLGFVLGPLFGYFALTEGQQDPGPGPGYLAAGLSAIALAMAAFVLPESLRPGTKPTQRGWMNFHALTDALSVPSVGLLLLASFFAVFAFANFETTLSLVLKDESGAFHFNERGIMLVFAYIGAVLTVAQGGLVRRLSGKVSEGHLAIAGSAIELVGLGLLAGAGITGSHPLLYVGLAVVVTGFACVTPSINSLLSRRSDPAKQGGIAGLGQSASSLARILGPATGIPLVQSADLANSLGLQKGMLPLIFGAVVMLVAMGLISLAANRGQDFDSAGEQPLA